MPQRAFVMRVVNDVRPHVNETSGRRFKNSLLWRAFLRGCVFGDRLNRIRVHVRPHRRQKKMSVFKQKWMRVDGALVISPFTLGISI